MNIFKIILKAYKKAYSGLPGGIWVLALVRLIDASGSMVFSFLSLYLTQKLGFSLIQAGQVLSVYGAGALIGSLAGGKLTDRFGAYAVQFSTLGLTGLIFIILFYLPSFLLIAIAMFVQGVVLFAFGPANAATVSQVCLPDQRLRGYAMNRLADNIGLTIGPAVGGVLAVIDYGLLFWVDGLTCLIGAFTFAFYFKSRLHTPKVSGHKKSSGRSPLRDFYFIKILCLSFLIAVIFNQIITSYPLYFRTVYGFAEDRIGLLLAISSIMVILFEMLLLDALKKRPTAKIIARGCLFFGAGFALMPLGRGFLFAGLTVIVWTVGEMMLLPTLNTLVADHAAESKTGSYMGLYYLSFSLGMIAGPAAGMWFYEKAGPDALWASIGILGIVLWLGFSSTRGSNKSKS